MGYNNACRRCLQRQGVLASTDKLNSYATVVHGKTAFECASAMELSLVPFFSIWCTKCEELSVNLAPLSVEQGKNGPVEVAAYLTHMASTLKNMKKGMSL
jgi:thiol-disulfide isomerase/thioredoxin